MLKAHSHTHVLIDAYGSDSTPASSSSDDDSGEFRTSHWCKRRRTGKEARDNAALGVFGSDGEHEDGRHRGRHNGETPLRVHGMGFVKAKGEDLSMGDYGHGDVDHRGVDGDSNTGCGKDRVGKGEVHLDTFSGLGRRLLVDKYEDIDEGSAGRSRLGAVKLIRHSRRDLGAANVQVEEQDSYNTWEGQERPQSGFGRSLGACSAKATLFKGFMEPSPEAGPQSLATSTGEGPAPNSLISGVSPLEIDRQGLESTNHPPGAFESPLGRGFVSSIARQLQYHPVLVSPQLQHVSPPVTPHPSFTDKSHQSRGTSGKMKGSQPYFDVNPNSFAARMMAKMGYVPGRGLGSHGQGILTPIEVRLRPQGVGVGAIKEKTEQAKAEARRAAFLRGEALSESESEKERRKAKKKAMAASKTKGAPVVTQKAKPIFRAADDIEKYAVDLMVPRILKSVVDMTGPEVKVLDPHLGLFIKAMPKTENPSPEEEEKLRVARMAKTGLEQFVTEWQRLQEKKTYTDQEEHRLTEDLNCQTAQVQRLSSLLELMEKMKYVDTDDEDSSVSVGQYRLQRIVEQLETLQLLFQNGVEVYKLSELSIAAITPVFKQCIALWTPLTNPFLLTELLGRLRSLFKFKSRENIEARYNNRGYLDQPSKTATPYESLIYNFWLPKVRSAINNQWDVHNPSPVLCLLEAWDPLLPSYIYANILNHLVLPKLRTAIAEWNPLLESRSRSKRKGATTTPPPHIWIFPWLPYLNTQMHLPSLLSDIKTKFSILLSSYPLNSGPLEGLPEWAGLLGSSVIENLFTRKLLPRLALLLRSEFTVNPADQDLSALETVWRWKAGFKPSTLSQLLQTELFPKWLATLHLWLTTPGVLLGEVSEWYRFWQGAIPVDLRTSPIIISQFDKGLKMINLAMDLGPGSERARKELPAPEEGPQRPINITGEMNREDKWEWEKRKGTEMKKREGEQVLFKDAIDDWCTENNLLLIPLRKADEKSGQPLFRITASTSGIGGVIVYLSNDVVWVQDNNIRGKFEPTGLDHVLNRVESHLGKIQ